MSLPFWESAVLSAGEGAGVVAYAVSCVSPAARVAVEGTPTGIAWALGSGPGSGDCAALGVPQPQRVVQLRVGRGGGGGEAGCAHTAAAVAEWTSGVLSAPAWAPLLPPAVRQLVALGTGRPVCFDWWVARARVELPLSLVVLGAGGAALRPPADRLKDKLLAATVDAAEALAMLVEAGPLPRLVHLRVGASVATGAAATLSAAFPHLRTLVVYGTPAAAAVTADLAAVALCTTLEELVLKWCRPTCATAAAPGEMARLRVLHVEGCAGPWCWAQLPAMPRLESLHLDTCDAASDTPQEPLPPFFPHLRRLNATFAHLQQLDVLSACGALEQLAIREWGAAALPLSRLGGAAASLRELAISDSAELRVVDVGPCGGLTSLQVHWCEEVAEVRVGGCSALATLDLAFCDALASVVGLPSAEGLRSLSVSHCALLRGLGAGQVASLEELRIEECEALSDAPEESTAVRPWLRRLHLDGTRLQALELSEWGRLVALRLERCDTLSAVSAAAECRFLTEVALSDCDAVTAIDVAGCGALETLSVVRCSEVRRIEGLAGKSALRAVSLEGCCQLLSVDVRGCVALGRLRCANCWALTAVLGLAGLRRLREVLLSGCFALAAVDVRGCAALPDLTRDSNAGMTVLA